MHLCMILTPDTLFMTPNMNNSVCPHLAGFCLKTGFALGLDIDQGRTRRKAAQLMFWSQGNWAAHCRGCFSPDPTQHGVHTRHPLSVTHPCSEDRQAQWLLRLIPDLRFQEGEKELKKVLDCSDPRVSCAQVIGSGWDFPASQAQSWDCLIA